MYTLPGDVSGKARKNTLDGRGAGLRVPAENALLLFLLAFRFLNFFLNIYRVFHQFLHTFAMDTLQYLFTKKEREREIFVFNNMCSISIWYYFDGSLWGPTVLSVYIRGSSDD